MTLVVTGGAGFIGSAAVCHAVRAGHDVLTIDKLTYAARRAALTEVSASPRPHLLQADIADSRAMETAFRDFDPDAVLHLAAESHVDRSIDTPEAFVATNVRGTFVLLEAALRRWSRLRGARRDGFRFVQVSIDEVFGTLGDGGPFNASSRYAPNSPYAAGKAAADHSARAWHRTYGIPRHRHQLLEQLRTPAARGKIGPDGSPACARGCANPDLWDRRERSGFRPRSRERPYGRPMPWPAWRNLSVRRTLQRRNFELVRMICALLDARRPRADGKFHAEQITFVSDRPGHDLRYGNWYLANTDWLIPVKDLGRLGTPMAEFVG